MPFSFSRDFKEDFERYLREHEDDEDDDDEPVPAVEVYFIDDSPGTGVDCDDCGYTPDRLEYHEFSDGTYHLHMSYGCTGGGYLVHQSPQIGLTLVEDNRGLFNQKVVDSIKERLSALTAE